MSRNLVKAPSPVILDRLHKEALRACGARRQSGDPNARIGFLRKVHVEFNRRMEAAGIYVEHAGMAETQTEEWRQRDRADEMRELSWLTAIRKVR
jgi:hypothetical protein